MPITDLGYQVICSRFISKIEQELIIIVSLTESEEKKLDKGDSIIIDRGGHTFYIDEKAIIGYGDVDMNTGSDDYNIIESMNWLDHLSSVGLRVPADYDYKTHCCYSPIKSYRHYDTTNPAVITQYLHGVLGKPKYCCIFKEKVNKHNGSKRS